MKVYRLERRGYGPYNYPVDSVINDSLRRDITIAMECLNYLHGKSLDHPSARIDFSHVYIPNISIYIFGFANIDDLYGWFHDSIYDQLYKVGFRIYEYDVPECNEVYVGSSGLQLCFDPKNSTKKIYRCGRLNPYINRCPLAFAPDTGDKYRTKGLPSFIEEMRIAEDNELCLFDRPVVLKKDMATVYVKEGAWLSEVINFVSSSLLVYDLESIEFTFNEVRMHISGPGPITFSQRNDIIANYLRQYNNINNV